MNDLSFKINNTTFKIGDKFKYMDSEYVLCYGHYQFHGYSHCGFFLHRIGNHAKHNELIHSITYIQDMERMK